MLRLIPAKPASFLVNRKAKLAFLHLMNVLIDEAIEALSCFLRREFSAFDAQVGETSCQIRAYKVCLLDNTKGFSEKVMWVKNQLNEYKKIFEHVLEEYKIGTLYGHSYSEEMDKREILKGFLKRKGLSIFFDSDIIFLITSHFLKKYCLIDNEEIPCAINYPLIKKSLFLGSTPARNLTNHYQLVLSKLSCAFVLNLLKSYSDEDGNYRFMQYFIREGDQGRRMLPYYNAVKILLSSAQTSGLPILFSVYKVMGNRRVKWAFLFKLNKTTHEYSLQKRSDMMSSDESCVVFKGTVFCENKNEESVENYLTRLFSYKPNTVILDNAAAHPQYAGEKQAEFKEDPYKDLYSKIAAQEQTVKKADSMQQEFFKAKEEAHRMGLSRENPSLFYIKHIFCDLVKNEAAESLIWSSSSFQKQIFTPILLKQLDHSTA